MTTAGARDPSNAYDPATLARALGLPGQRSKSAITRADRGPRGGCLRSAQPSSFSADRVPTLLKRRGGSGAGPSGLALTTRSIAGSRASGYASSRLAIPSSFAPHASTVLTHRRAADPRPR